MIEYQYGQGIEDRDVYAKLLREEWGPYGPADVEVFERRILNAGNYIIAMRYEGKPAAILETLRTPIIDPSEIGDFSHLTGNGTFSTHTPNGRMLVMVDLTVKPEYRDNLGLGKRMIREQLPRYLGNGIEIVRTFSPVTARRLHEPIGAYQVGEIKDGRREYSKSPNVLIFEYPIELIELFAIEKRPFSAAI